jgi:SpoVK/Ycf46/Vps4 family AAA+-type ATPase
MFIGHAGVAKSACAKALGNEAGIPTIQLDLGNAKGSLIGESNANMQMILKVIEAVSQGRALWIATCNDIGSLAPELRSRYTFGTFFFDLPTISERELIWKIYFDKYELADRSHPPDTGWTGREIRNCCKLAHRLDISLKEAASYIVPIYTSARERIVNLRNEADGRYISAAAPGTYKKPEGMEEEVESPTLVAVAVMPGQKKRNINPGGKGGGGSVN